MKKILILGVVFIVVLLGFGIYHSYNSSNVTRTHLTGGGTTTYTMNGQPAFEDSSGKYIISITPNPLIIELDGGSK